MDLSLQKKQVTRLKKFKAARDSKKSAVALAHLGKAARGSENMMPHILAAVKAHATLGEISQTMRDVFGKHKERPTI